MEPRRPGDPQGGTHAPRGAGASEHPSGGGGLALLTDSADVTRTVVERLRRHDAGLAWAVTLGEVDVAPEELIAAWAEDGTIRAAAVCLGTSSTSPALVRAARAFARRKPLLTVPPRRTARSPARRTGLVRCADLADLADTGLLLGSQPSPRGPRLGVVASSALLAAEVGRAAQRAGLAVTRLTASCERRLALASDGVGRAENPVSLDLVADPAAVADVVGTLLDSTEVDAVLLALARTPARPSRALLHELEAVVRGVDVPVVVGAPRGTLPSLGAPPVPVLTASSAVRAIAHGAERADWLAHASETDPDRRS